MPHTGQDRWCRLGSGSRGSRGAPCSPSGHYKRIDSASGCRRRRRRPPTRRAAAAPTCPPDFPRPLQLFMMKLRMLLQRTRGGVLLLGAPEGCTEPAAQERAAASEEGEQVCMAVVLWHSAAGAAAARPQLLHAVIRTRCCNCVPCGVLSYMCAAPGMGCNPSTCASLTAARHAHLWCAGGGPGRRPRSGGWCLG